MFFHCQRAQITTDPAVKLQHYSSNETTQHDIKIQQIILTQTYTLVNKLKKPNLNKRSVSNTSKLKTNINQTRKHQPSHNNSVSVRKTNPLNSQCKKKHSTEKTLGQTNPLLSPKPKPNTDNSNEQKSKTNITQQNNIVT